jgi:hypothetical protein
MGLKKQITSRLQAALLKEDRLEQLSESSVVADVQGLSQMEIVALVTIAENADSPEDFVGAWSIRQDMERSGYTRIAVTLALTSLLRKDMVDTRRDSDQNGNDYSLYHPTPRGLQWLMDNQDRLVLRRQRLPPAPDELSDEDVPF